MGALAGKVFRLHSSFFNSVTSPSDQCLLFVPLLNKDSLTYHVSIPVYVAFGLRAHAVHAPLTYWHPVSPLHWRHNDHDGVSNHQHHGCLLNRLFRRRSKKTKKSSASLAFVWGIHRDRWVSPHKGPVTRKMFPFDDVIMAIWRHIPDYHPR